MLFRSKLEALPSLLVSLDCSLVQTPVSVPPIRHMVTITPLAGTPVLVSRMWEDTGSWWDLVTLVTGDTVEPTSGSW